LELLEVPDKDMTAIGCGGADEKGLRNFESLAVRGGLTRWQMRKVKAHIDANIGARIPCGELAELVRLSIGHFFRAFRVSFGASPQSYIMRQRMLRAKMLMLTSNEPLTVIAMTCGLCDQAHFSRAFRRAVGVSPKHWRREHGSTINEALLR
jgi:AraC family transcriptional regulator